MSAYRRYIFCRGTIIATIAALIVVCLYFTALPISHDCLIKSSVGDKFMPDIMEYGKKPVVGRSIFFHETTCAGNRYIQLNSRQACAVESAALLNPNSDVFVIFTGANLMPNNSRSETLKALSSYANVHFRSLNLITYAANTPAAVWLNAGNLLSSKYLSSHLSDFLRYLTLYKWGGTYLDLDVIVKRDLQLLEINYAGAESASYVASGVMNLDNTGVGRRIASLLLKNLLINFNGNNWGNNGPGVITRVLQKICRTTRPTLMSRQRCNGFQVYHINSFYAIPWQKWEHFFSPINLEYVLNRTQNSTLVHVWNHHSQKYSLYQGEKVAYTVLAKEYCPEVYYSVLHEGK